MRAFRNHPRATGDRPAAKFSGFLFAPGGRRLFRRRNNVMRVNNSLTADRLRKLILYKPVTGAFYWRVSRGSLKSGWPAGCIDKRGKIRIRIDGVVYFASRLAWLYMTGEWPRGEVDHKDVNPSNNEWGNLRDATRQQNQANTKPWGKTGLKGVYRIGDKFLASIRHSGRLRRLGRFSTAVEAAVAYEDAAKSAFGDFARFS
jgi:hypothetical protein